MNKTWIVLLLVISLHAASGQITHVTATAKHYGKYVFVACAIVIVAVIRHLVLHTFRTSIPYSVFGISIGILWGVGALYFPWMMDFVADAPMWLQILPVAYLPVLIYSAAFCTDMYTFMKSLPQILIISFPVFTFNAVFCGTLMRLVINPQWDIMDGVLFGALLSAVYPLDTFKPLRESSSHTTHVTMLLKGEMIISMAYTVYFHEMLIINIQGWIVHWYQFASGILRVLFLGLPVGYCCGLFGALLMRLAHNEPITLMTVTVGMCYFSFWVCENIANTGSLGVMLSGMLMGIERRVLTTEVERSVTQMWKITGNVMNGLVYVVVGVMGPIIFRNYLAITDYVYVLVTYLICNISRLLGFLLFSPILSRLGYGFTFQNMIVCVWGGLKNPVDLSLSVNLDQVFVDRHKAMIFFLHHMLVYMLFLLINGTFFPAVLKALGLAEPSISRQVNMNNCMKYIKQARERAITILKMDRFLSDANWPLVNTATILQHPYKVGTTKETEIDEEEDEFFLGYRFGVCGECKRSVPTEPTHKELREMTREARMRVLKLKKIAYSRQYQNGMLSRDGVRILHQAVEIAMDTEKAVIELDGLIDLFNKEGYVHQFLKIQLLNLLKSQEESITPSRKYFRLLCYRLIINRFFKAFIYLTIFFNVVFGIYCFFHMQYTNADQLIVDISFDLFFFSVYFSEFVITIFAYSRISVWEDGFHTYFNSGWHLLDFTVLSTTLLDLLLDLVFLSLELWDAHYYQFIVAFFCVMKLVRGLRFLRLLTVFNATYNNIITSLDRKINKHRAVAFELGKNYITGEDEILENLPYIVDNERIRNALRDHSENDRLIVSKMFGIAQKERTWIAVSVKTQLALRMVLNGIRDDINELKVSGWVDDVEYALLMKSLGERYTYADSIKSIEPSAPREIFRHVAWMGDDQTIISLLYKRVGSKKFDPGDVVFKEGKIADGIYILVSGLFKLSYTANEQTLKDLNKTGSLPVVDHVSMSQFHEAVVDYIGPGNSVGELSTLTKRPYNCVITAETYSQAYFLSRQTVLDTIKKDPDPVNGLECRIWKNISYSIALPIMMDLPTYRSYTQEKMKYVIERSFIPDISNYKVFYVNDMMEDVILIEGIVMDFVTKTLFTGPCEIPRTVQKIILPKSSQSTIACDIEIRLLIIPGKDFDEYDIMVDEEEVCEMVNDKASKCLQHLIQQRGTDFKAAKMRRRQFMNYNKYFGSMQSLTSSIDRSKPTVTDRLGSISTPVTTSVRNVRESVVSTGSRVGGPSPMNIRPSLEIASRPMVRSPMTTKPSIRNVASESTSPMILSKPSVRNISSKTMLPIILSRPSVRNIASKSQSPMILSKPSVRSIAPRSQSPVVMTKSSKTGENTKPV